MAKIISYEECFAKCHIQFPGTQCPYPSECKRASKEFCSECKTHCPCCVGHEEGFCDRCSEEDCDNRNKPYDPNAISKEG